MDLLKFLVPVIALAALCAGWVAVQFLARKAGTKNHFDNKSLGCGSCTCGSVCEKETPKEITELT